MIAPLVGLPFVRVAVLQAAENAEAIQDVAAEVPSAAAVFALAVVQGLTEFLPVSSSGHLALGRALLDVNEGGLALDVALDVGTLLAIVWAFRRDVLRRFGDLLKGRLRTWVWLGIATVPVGVIGLTFKDTVETAATSVTAAGCGLLITAAFLLIGEWGRRRNESKHPEFVPEFVPVSGAHSGPIPDGPLTLRWGDAVAMGLAQAAAIWPGISRSGSTISAGLVRGLPAAEAARLSFLMSLPAISGAAIVELPDALHEGFGGLSPWLVLAAAAVAGLVGWGALVTLMFVLRRKSFPYFAAYCAVLGTIALAVA